MDSQEFLSTTYLESIKADLEKNAETIRERAPETLRRNFVEAKNSLDDFYYVSRISERRFKLFVPKREQLIKELNQKSKIFTDYFKHVVFASILHSTDEEIPEDETQEVTLKSPSLLAEEKGQENSETSRHQGEFDKTIGSNELVFANSKYLTSRSFSGTKIYDISSSEACVIPLDIDDILPPGKVDESKYLDALRVHFISRNIFNYEDFKEFFARYCAVVFETPEEALAFFKHNYHIPLQAGVWESEESVQKNVRSSDEKKHAIKIRSLYVNKGIVPPFSPEWQYKNKVRAKRVK